MRWGRPIQMIDVCHAQNWDDLISLQKWFERGGNRKWIFRGQKSAAWDLKTSLERALKRFDRRGEPISKLEGGLLRQFQRRAHHYLPQFPPNNAWVEWLALMQHHGAPTRLMDWTYSFFVAAYFAIEEAETRCAIWALDTDWITQQLEGKLQPPDWKLVSETDRNMQDPETFRRVFAKPKKDRVPLVCAVNPFWMNQRLSIQQGVFLCPGDVSTPFIENLAAMFPARKANRRLVKCILTFNRDAIQDSVKTLIRMNMTRTSLFPGLDGFARSQALGLALPETLVPDKDFPYQ